MMTRKFLLYCILTLVFVGNISATDTTQTPTPAQVISTPIAANTDIEALITNQAMITSTIRLNPRAVSFVQNYTIKNKKPFGD